MSKQELPSIPENPVFIWDHDRRRIVWANRPALRFWGERTTLDLLDREFAQNDETVLQFAQLLDSTIRTSKDKLRARIMLAPIGRPVRVDAFASPAVLDDGRPGLRIELEPAPIGEAAELDRLRAIFERSPQALALYSESGRLLLQNSAAEAMFETSNGTGLADQYGSRRIARNVLRAVLVEGSFNHAHTLFTRYGEKRLRIDARRILDPVSENYAALIQFTDNVEQRDTFIREGADQNAAEAGLVASLGAGVIVFDDALRPLFMNEKARSFLNLPKDSSLPSLGELLPGNREELISAIVSIREGQVETKLLYLNASTETGSKKRLRMSIQRGGWRRAGAWVATLIDITSEHRAAVTAQRVAIDRDKALSKMDIGVFALRSDGSIAFTTETARALLGIQRAGPSSINEFLDADSTSKLFQSLSGDRQIRELTVKAMSAGQPLTVSLAPANAINRNYRIGVIRSVLSKSGTRATSVFGETEAIARASHELRTPLTAILGFTQLMLSAPNPIQSAEYVAYLRDIEESGEYMLRLLQDLLDLRRMEAGSMEVEAKPLDLSKLLRTLIRQHESAASKRHVRLSASIEEKLPHIIADTHTLRQAISNLIGNAVKFTASPGWVRISLTRRSTGALELEIIDNGDGMTEDELRNALQPFVQGSGSRKSFGGAGMGLPLAKGFIEANGAKFKMRSAKEMGTIAKIIFPKDILSIEII